MKRDVRVDGEGGPMELTPTAGGWRFSWEGREGEIEAIEVEPGVYSILWNGRSYEARAIDGGVRIDGRFWRTEAVDPREAAAGAGANGPAGPAQVAAPMPGKVIRALVEEGQQVAAGQGLVVVEAMKMQNEMQAPRAGRVVALRAREGAAVAAGEVLVVIE